MKTKVIFRKYRNGNIIALFPDITEKGYKVQCFEHAGQHSTADYQAVINQTAPASQDEYKGLFNELSGYPYYYDLIVKQRAKIAW